MNTDEKRLTVALNLVCPNCKQRIEAPWELHGTNVACPTCGEQFLAKTEEERFEESKLGEAGKRERAALNRPLPKIESPWGDRSIDTRAHDAESGRLQRWGARLNVIGFVALVLTGLAVLAAFGNSGDARMTAEATYAAVGFASAAMVLFVLGNLLHIRAGLSRIAEKD